MISESEFPPRRSTIFEERAQDVVFNEMVSRLEKEMLQTKEFQEAIHEAAQKKCRALQPEDIFEYPVLQQHFMDYIRTMAPIMLFDIIVQLYQPLLYTLAMRILGNRHSAEDIVQESLMKAYVAMKSYSVEQLQTLRIRPWLCTIVRNTANNYRLHERRFELLDLSEDDGLLEIEGNRFEQPEVAILRDETQEEFQELLRRLPPKYRVVVLLRFWESLNNQEIAEILDWRLGTLKSNIHRSLRLLKKIVEDMDIQERDLKL